MTEIGPENCAQSTGPTYLGPVDLLALAAWCGLAAGELEVAARVVPRAVDSTNRLYMMTRHFVWLVPLVNLTVFLLLGTLAILMFQFWPRRLRWLSPRLIIAAALLPVLTTAGRRIYIEAWLLVAVGVAVCVVPVLERRPAHWRRWLLRTAPILLGIVLIQGGWIAIGDQIKQWREKSRSLPPTGSPNVLLIVLDTVRADHLGLYGYSRPTTTTLDRLAKNGIRFDQARATRAVDARITCKYVHW